MKRATFVVLCLTSVGCGSSSPPPAPATDAAVAGPDTAVAADSASMEDVVGGVRVTPDEPDAGPLVPVDIRGVYVVGSKAAQMNGTLATALAGPGIDGVLVKVGWSDLTTAPKVYDWTALDAQAHLAADTGQKFELAITLGGSAPAWLFAAAPAGLGAMPVNLQYADKAGANGRCLPVVEARPWDPIYLAALDDLLTQLAQHLRDANLYRRLSMVRLTAINGWTDELRLPAQTPKTIPDLPCITDSVQIWMDAGYRPSLLLGGWAKALDLYKQHFPNKTFNVAVLAGGSFPPIGEDGLPAMNGTAPAMVAKMVSDLIAAAAQALPGKLVIQENNLVGDAPPDGQVTAAAATNSALFAWQSNEWLMLAGGAACGGSFAMPVPCTVDGWHNLLDNGIHPPRVAGQAQYLELFAPNTLMFPVETRMAHQVLVK
jgi:hypothetical protein